MRTFGTFTFEEVQDLFGIEKEKELPLLTQWQAANIALTEHERFELVELKDELLSSIYNWNEDELKMFFIGPLIRLVKLETKEFKPFTQRVLTATISPMEVTGRVDFMVAKGLRTAKPPYFCIHEYTCTERSRSEQEVDDKGDPLGQLLIAMLCRTDAQ